MKNKLFGWIFVLYPLLLIITPIIGIILIFFGVTTKINDPIGLEGLDLIFWNGMLFLPSLIIFNFMRNAITPFLVFVSGILLFQNKKSGIRLAIIIFSIDLISSIFVLITNYYYKFDINKYRLETIISFSIFLLIDIFIIYYFTKNKDKIIICQN